MRLCIPSVAQAPAIGFVLSVFFCAPAPAQTAQSEPNGPTIVTTGEGVVRRAPDRAFVEFTVESRARNPKEAQQQNAEAMTKVQRRLAGANLPKDAVRTTGYSVDPEYDFANGRQTLRDYVARNTIEVRLDDLGRLGEMIDIAAAAGATAIGDVRFELRERQLAEREALGQAVTDARAKADAMATASGRTILQIWRMVEEPLPSPGPRPMMLARGAAEGAPQTPIVAGDIEIRARVTLTVLIK